MPYCVGAHTSHVNAIQVPAESGEDGIIVAPRDPVKQGVQFFLCSCFRHEARLYTVGISRACAASKRGLRWRPPLVQEVVVLLAHAA
jgi:hypothetical protein